LHALREYSIVLWVQSASCVKINGLLPCARSCVPIQPKDLGCVGSCTEHADETAYSLTSQFCVLAFPLLQFIIANKTDLPNVRE